MKNRNFVIIAIVLVSVICLGVIGYAGFHDDLTVSGYVEVDNYAANEDFDNDIHFNSDAGTITAKLTAFNPTTEQTPETTKDPTFVDTNSDDKDDDGVVVTVGKATNGDANDLLSIRIDAGVLNFKDDKLVVIAKIVNESTEFDAEISANSNTVTDGANFTTATIQFCNTEAGTYANTLTLEKGNSCFAKVTITLNETITTTGTGATNSNFSFDLNANYTEPNS